MEVETGTEGAALEESVVSGSIFAGWETSARLLPVAVDGARVVDRLPNGSSFFVPPAQKTKQLDTYISAIESYCNTMAQEA